MISFNFLSSEYKEKLKTELNTRLLYVAGGVFIIWVVIFSITIVSAIQFLNIQNNALEQSIENVSQLKETEEAQNLEDKITELNQLFIRINEIKETVPYNVTFMANNVASLVPDGIYLTKLEVTPRTSKITVSGHADLRSQVFTFQSALEESEFFQEVDLPLSYLVEPADLDFNIILSLPSDEQ